MDYYKKYYKHYKSIVEYYKIFFTIQGTADSCNQILTSDWKHYLNIRKQNLYKTFKVSNRMLTLIPSPTFTNHLFTWFQPSSANDKDMLLLSFQLKVI